MDRREFLKCKLAGAVWLAAGSPWLLSPAPALADSLPHVATARGGPAAATRAAVELLGGMGRFVSRGDKVVIKPNMSFPNPPKDATNTHPAVVRALAEMCREAGASKVLVLDHPLSSAERCVEGSGIREACRTLDENMVFGLSSERFFREAEIPGAEQMRENEFMKDVLDADRLIACPVAKSHSSTGVSLSLKGMMGLIMNRGVMHWRYDLDTAIVDLNTKLRADLAVIDGTRVLTTNGPYGPGRVVEYDTVIASADQVAADAQAVAAFEWYGRKMRPGQVGHIRAAHERGLGRMDVENLDVRSIDL